MIFRIAKVFAVAPRNSCILLAVVFLSACSDAPPQRPADVTPDYSLLAPCVDQGEGIPFDHVAGVTLPPGAVIFDVHETPPLTQLSGYVEQTPLQIREFYETQQDVQVLNIEDEGFEAEVLIGGEQLRMYAKANVVCETGSNLTATVGPGSDTDLLPSFGGAAAPATGS